MTTSTQTAVKIDTRAFRRKHGREPRGRSLWSFRLGTDRLWFSIRADYAEAAEAAAATAAAKGYASVSGR
jgi:hypothetical protein